MELSTHSSHSSVHAENKVQGHPKALYYIFFTEMWERFSFYGLRALLVLYMTKVFLFSDAKAYLVFGSYMALVYMTPVIGGLIADRLIGHRRAVIFGGILITLGNVMLALPLHSSMFYIGLATVVTGTGFFKGNISCIVGHLYKNNEASRDSGYTLFYMGINIGSFFATTVIAGIGETVNWYVGFAIAALGMTTGLITFMMGQHLLNPDSDKVNQAVMNKKCFLGIKPDKLVYLAALITIPGFAWLIANPIGSANVLISVGLLILGYIFYQAAKSSKEERNHLFFILIASFLSMLFFSFFEQGGSSMTLFADRNLNRDFFGFEITAAMTQAFNPLFIILLAPLFSMLWVRLEAIGKSPSTPAKFAIALLCVGLGFGLLALSAKEAMITGTSSLNWLIVAYLFFTIGELCLSPVGLSMISKLAPTRLVGLLMGAWFLAAAFSQYLGAIIASFTNISPELIETAGKMGSAGVYYDVFYKIFIAALIFSAFTFIITPLMKKLAKS